jgi:translocation and assembly module TamB
MAADAPPAAPAPRRRRAWIAWAAVAGGMLAVGLAAWLALMSEAGLRWLLVRVPGLSAQGVQGSLGRGHIEVRQLRWAGPAGRLEMDELVLDGLRWRWRPAPGQWLGLQADALRSERVQWTTAPGDATTGAPAPPDSLALPLALRMPLSVGRLQVDSAPELRGLTLRLELGADDGTVHRVSALSLDTAGVRLRDGRVQLGARAPMALDAALSLAGDDSAPLPWRADVQARGPLRALELTGRLRSGDASAVDLSAALSPFARWPLARLQLQTDALDLSLLDGRLPKTRLRGRADLGGGDGTPLQVDLALDNERPGRWDEGALPLRRIEARLQGDLARPGRVTIESLSLQAADGGGDAGRWEARGSWEGHTLTLDNTLAGLRPGELDGRAPRMSLEGKLALSVQGLPSPDPAASAPADPVSAALDARLQGRLEGTPKPVSLQARAVVGADRVQLDAFELVSGGARAQGRLRLERQGPRWTVSSQGRLDDFDPTLWWPAGTDAAWPRGPHRLNADWAAELSVAQSALTKAPQAWLAALQGHAKLQVRPSTLAGLAVQAELSVADAAGGELAAWVDLAGNRVQVDGRTDLRGDGAADRWQLALDAPALAALAPLAALHPGVSAWAPRDGRASVHATLQGRWPRLQTEGEATLDGLQAAEFGVGRASLKWRAEEGLTAPLSAQLTIENGRWAGQQLQSLHAGLSGTLEQHRLQAQAVVPLLPPPAVARSLALTLRRGTRASLELDGAWLPQPGRGGRWSGQVRRAEVASWNGESLPAPKSAAPWAEAADLRAEVEFAADGSLLQARADPGRLRLAGGIALGWDDIRYDSAGQRIALKAQLEDFRLAPLLARWQPDLGWSGDLEVALTVDLRAAQNFDADVVIERRGGDLSVLDSTDQPLKLGLTDLRLAVNAHDGTWYFTQALAGSTLGELGGAIRVRTSPERRWPDAGAALDGAVRGRVANLGVWGTWVPPGWRLQGQLQTQASFGGSFGAPEVNGELTGRGLGARNILLGVNVHDGEVAVRLDGERATVENFVLHAGEGRLRLTGGARLGASPEAQLAMTADKLQVLGRIDRRLVVSGNAALTLDPRQLALNGKFTVDSGLFDTSLADAPSLDEDVVVLRNGALPPEPKDAGAESPARRTDVRVTVDLGQQLRLRGRGLDTRLAGQLRVTAPGGRLAVNGSVNTVSGTFAAYGQKMVIERGQLAFSGAPDNPRLDVLALRPNLDVDVGVEIFGSVNAPRVRLYSNPDMSDSEKLSWLVLGREPGAAGRTDTALLQRAAVALLAGEGESASDRVIRDLGLDELSVGQSPDNAQETVVTLGKRISDRWYVGYERGVNATAGTWQVIYRAARRFTLRLQSGLEQSVDVLWVWQVP